MKLTLLNVMTTWLCATGASIVTSHCITLALADTPSGEREAQRIARRIERGGTVQDYKPEAPHSSVVRKTTRVKISTRSVGTSKACTQPVYVPNPIYPFFKNALGNLTVLNACQAKSRRVALNDGFSLAAESGGSVLCFPEAYGRVGIGGVALGDEVKDGTFSLRTAKVTGVKNEVVEEVVLNKSKRLKEPEFYCSDVTYSLLPATRQAYAIKMHGDLSVKNEWRARRVIREIKAWMQEDYGAVDQRAEVPSDKLAYKKLKIGKGLDVEISLTWNEVESDEKGDAHIDISFTASELVEENQCECQELGQAMDEARVRMLEETGVNYYTIQPEVLASQVNRGVVY